MQRLEGGNIPLEDMVALYERGAELGKAMHGVARFLSGQDRYARAAARGRGMKYQDQQKRYIALTEDALRVYLGAEDIPQLLRESMAYSVFARRETPAALPAACIKRALRRQGGRRATLCLCARNDSHLFAHP